LGIIFPSGTIVPSRSKERSFTSTAYHLQKEA
jgi:hypothetical protein